MKIQSYRELEVWKLAIDFADRVYDVTQSFPKEEIYGLCAQLRRSAVSIPSNIAEGSARYGTKELLYFIGIAQGSLAELETQLILSERRNYLSANTATELLAMSASINRMLTRLYQSLQKKVA